jgi:EmrB/QacA subfamily drug resistance transporter
MQRKWRVTLIVCVGVFMSSLDLFIVNIAFPDIEREFAGSSLASLSWVLNAYAIIFAALLVPAGRWADAFGRKRVFLTGLAVFVAASALCALAPSVGWLIGARIVQAAGGALMLPTSLGLMLPEFEPHERGAAIGIWAATGGAAAAAGPPLGGLLVQADWRLVFLVNLPVGLAGLAYGARRLVERAEPGALRPDLLGAAAFVVAIGALTVAIVKGGDWAAGYAVCAVLLPAILWRSARHPSPLVDPVMLRERNFALAVLGSIVFFTGFGSMLLAGVLFTTGVWHVSVLTAGLMLAPGPALAASFSVPAARLAAKVGFRVTGTIGALLFSLGPVWWTLRVGPTPAYASEYLPGMILTGIGVGFMLPTLTGAGAASLPPARLATGIAVITMGRQVGSALGIAILVAVLGTGVLTVDDFHGAWAITLSGGVSAGLLLLALGRGDVADSAPDGVRGVQGGAARRAGGDRVRRGLRARPRDRAGARPARRDGDDLRPARGAVARDGGAG